MAPRESVLCLSDRRCKAGIERARQLSSRCARQRPVARFEAPVFDVSTPVLELSTAEDGVLLAIPHLPPHLPRWQADAAQRRMINQVVAKLGDARMVLWYCAPTATGFTGHLEPTAIVYDCTRAGASLEAAEHERWLFERADVVFTDSYSLYRDKRRTTGHPNIHPFLSGVDIPRFGEARAPTPSPPEQDEISRPRVGYCGVIDERVDLRLLAELAVARPDLHFVLVGPIVNVDSAALPQAENLHWLGAKPREQMLAYLAGWDVAMLPLRCRDVWMSPGKVGEYLAAGKPVVATRIHDVVEPYGRHGLAWIADNSGEFAEAIDEALASDRHARVTHADTYLLDHDWQCTWERMWAHVERAIAARQSSRPVGTRRTSSLPAEPSITTALR